MELAVWEKAKASGDAASIEDYLRRYPSGLFSELAQLRLDQLLGGTGERKIQLVSSDQNPYSKGTLVIDTRVKLGDRYAYREIDLATREENRRYTMTVTNISGSEVTFNWKAITVTDLLGNWIALPDGRRWTDAQFFIAEYSLGKRWTSRHRHLSQKGTQFSTEVNFRVAAREPVTVPAGTFDAFRVDGSGWAHSDAGTVQVTMRYWVTPSVRRWVAIESVHRGAKTGRLFTNHRIELLEHCCA